MTEPSEETPSNSSEAVTPNIPVPLLAWLRFRAVHRSVSVDRMVCNPRLRDGFLQILWRIDAGIGEETALWSLMTARKNKELRRFLAG